MLNTALLSQIYKKHMPYEKIILGRIRCEEAPQVVPAWSVLKMGKAGVKKDTLQINFVSQFDFDIMSLSVFTGLQIHASYLSILGLFIDVAAGGTCLEMKGVLFGLPTRRAR